MGKWIELETDASTGKPYLWKCDECGEEVTTRWNYCPECGDPKTSKGKSINTLVKALEAEHKKLREMQSATDKNVATTDTISRQAAIDALDEQIAQCNKAIKSFVLSMKDEYAAKVEKASLTAFRERLEYLPPAQPEIVRCKDCNHFYKDNLNQWCFLGKYGVKENGFCSRAERRTDERSD